MGVGARRTAVAVLVVLVGVTLALVIGRSTSVHVAAAQKLTKSDEMRAVRGAYKASKRDTAGNRGEPDGAGEETSADPSPTSAAEWFFARRAYPSDSIPASASASAQQTWTTYGENKEFTRSANPQNPFYWDLIGPTHATQPGILSFSGAQYHMSGRITAMQISPTCTTSNCRLWVAAAGGGVWRTDNPFSPDPYWTYLSKGFGTNAIGTIDRDPSDPTGNTLYAGTGEPNASGDSESGVGIYRTTDGGDSWTLLPGSKIFATRSISKVVVDPTNPSHLYVGVARGVRGVSSVTGGTFSRTGTCLAGPGGLSCRDGDDQAPLGLYESTDGGNTFTLTFPTTSARGVNDVGLDPTDPSTVYVAAFSRGIFRRSAVDGTPATFKRVFAPVTANGTNDRAQFDLTTVTGSGASAGTRMYVVDGATGTPASQVWRGDAINTQTAAQLLASQAAHSSAPSPNTGPGWALKSQRTSRPASGPYRPAYNPCEGQCWYDEDIYTPAGSPDVVYVIGSYAYNELHERSNGRGILLSTTGGDPDPTTAATSPLPNGSPDTTGGNFTDLTWDDTPGSQPDQQHPDFHSVLTPVGQPFLFFSGTDGGIVRSDGQFDNASADCLKYHVNDADTLVHCERVLSRVPHQLFDTMNKGLSTLQFQSVSLNPNRPQEDIQGGTQDNGTFDWDGAATTWYEEIYGDGGQSGYNYCDPQIRFNTFFGYYTDENFKNGQYDKWAVTSGPLSQLNNGETQAFYIPEVTDYTNCGALAAFSTAAAAAKNANGYNGQLGTLGFQYAGLQHVWRTVDNGGPEAYLEANCPEFTTSGDDPRCGDWRPLGDPKYVVPTPTATLQPTRGDPGDLTSAQYGPDRTGANVVAVERNPGNPNELWAATLTGRVFVSYNVNAVDPGEVQFCRVDQLSFNTTGGVAPPRFVSSIYPDPNNPNRAWISYDGYNSNTKDQPGHVFEVSLTQPAGSPGACPTAAVWRDLHVEQGTSAIAASAGTPDIPITDLVRDDYTGDLYAATDFGVLRGKSTDGGTTYTWANSGVNLPMVETAGITIDPCSRLLYAATHGRSVWRMYLPTAKNAPNHACPRTP